MYKVFVNDKLIFDDKLPDEDLTLIKPVLVMEDNAEGTFDFTLPLNHRYANEVDSYGNPFCGSLTDTITIYKNDKWLWEGRPISEDSDFYNQRQIHCEGALAYLRDTNQPLSTFRSTVMTSCVKEFLIKLINQHNAQKEKKHETNRLIYIDPTSSVIDVVPTGISTFTRTTNYETTLESINKRLVNPLGGHVRIRRVNIGNESKLILDYLADYPDVSGQKIEFGKNLLDFNKSVDRTEIATVIIPRGDIVEEDDPFFQNDSTFSDIQQRVHLGWFEKTNGKPTADQRIYANDDIIRRYGYIETTVEFDGIEAKTSDNYSSKDGWFFRASSVEGAMQNYNNASTVLQKGNAGYRQAYLHALKLFGMEYITNLQFDNLELELTVFDLMNLGIKDVQDFKLLDKVICSSTPHGMIDKVFPLRKMSITLNALDETRIVLGDTSKKTISATAGVSASTLEVVPNNSGEEYFRGLLELARNDADARISSNTNGYVTITTDEKDGRHSEAIVFTSDTKIKPDEDKSIEGLKQNHAKDGFWIWNYEGLAYYKRDAYNRDTTILAMTSDGKIVADAITTGTLNSITINTCKLNGCIIRCENPSNMGYYVEMKDGKITGGYNNLEYGCIEAVASVRALDEPGNPVYNGLAMRGDVIALDTDHLVIKNPDRTKHGGEYYISLPTVTLKNVEFTVNGEASRRGDLEFVEGLLVAYPPDVV